jgi:hypothetical protein
LNFTFKSEIFVDRAALHATSFGRVEGTNSLHIINTAETFDIESHSFLLVLHWLSGRPCQRHIVLPVADFRPMTGVLLPADQVTMQVYTSREPEDPEFTVDSILPFLGLGATECDLNHYVLPMQTSVQTYVCPALEAAESKWIPRDTTLEDSFRLHMLVCDRELFVSMRHFASLHNYVINLGGGNPANRILTYVELHCLPPTETVEVLGRMHKTLRKLRDDVAILKTEVRLLRRTFGQALENLAANYEELAPLVGLVAPPHIQGDPHGADDAEQAD